MQIEIATLFPEMCEAVLSESIIGRARAAGHISVRCWNIREYTLDKHRRVDDVPYGGGRGMVMQADPIYRCYDAVQQDIGAKPHVIYMSPKGRVLDQQRALELSVMPHIFVLCGHYEGVDQRILDGGMAAGRPPHCQARRACLSVHRLAAASRHDAGFAVGGLDLARRGGVG